MKEQEMYAAIEAALAASIGLHQQLRTGPFRDVVAKAASAIAISLKNGGKILIAGNGGSAADAQHFAAEFVGRFTADRPAYAAIALTTDSSMLTAWSNDVGFDSVFARQVQALGRPGDVFIGISTSGESKNILLAAAEARRIGMTSIGLIGRDGGRLRSASDISIIVPSNETPRIQECHILIIHMLCELVERALLSEER